MVDITPKAWCGLNSNWPKYKGKEGRAREISPFIALLLPGYRWNVTNTLHQSHSFHDGAIVDYTIKRELKTRSSSLKVDLLKHFVMVIIKHIGRLQNRLMLRKNKGYQHVSVIPRLGRLRQENYKFEGSLGYPVRPCHMWTTNKHTGKNIQKRYIVDCCQGLDEKNSNYKWTYGLWLEA